MSGYNPKDKSKDLKPGHGGPISEPMLNDVLCGRGGRVNMHSGNLYYRHLVNQKKANYLSKKTRKMEKVKIADEIVQAVRCMNPPGRFLKQAGKGQGFWFEIGDEKARKKAGQAMREHGPKLRKMIVEVDTTNQGEQRNPPLPSLDYCGKLSVHGLLLGNQRNNLHPLPQNQFCTLRQQNTQGRYNYNLNLQHQLLALFQSTSHGQYGYNDFNHHGL